MIQEFFSQTLKILTNLKGVPNLFRGTISEERLNYLVSPFCISILKILRTQILRYSLRFNAFYKIQGYVSDTFEICTN